MRGWKQKFADGILKGYIYNGCTAAPDLNFGVCCNRHDYDYQNMSKTRLQSDNDMFRCMWRKGPVGKMLAPIYWLAVRIFGGSHFKRKQDETNTRIGTALAQRLFDASRDIRQSRKLDARRGQDANQ